MAQKYHPKTCLWQTPAYSQPSPLQQGKSSAQWTKTFIPLEKWEKMEKSRNRQVEKQCHIRINYSSAQAPMHCPQDVAL